MWRQLFLSVQLTIMFKLNCHNGIIMKRYINNNVSIILALANITNINNASRL